MCFPNSFVEHVSWSGAPIQLDPDAASVLQQIVASRHACFPIKVRGRLGEIHRCFLEVMSDRIKVRGKETEVKDRWREDFKAILVPGKPDAVVLQLRAVRSGGSADVQTRMLIAGVQDRVRFL